MKFVELQAPEKHITQFSKDSVYKKKKKKKNCVCVWALLVDEMTWSVIAQGGLGPQCPGQWKRTGKATPMFSRSSLYGRRRNLCLDLQGPV